MIGAACGGAIAGLGQVKAYIMGQTSINAVKAYVTNPICIPVITRNGYTADKIAIPTNPVFSYNQIIADDKYVPINAPNGAKAHKPIGNIISIVKSG